MRPLTPFVLILVVTTAAAAAPALELTPGQSAVGRIAFSGEEDHVLLHLLSGESLTLKLVGEDGLRLSVRLLDPDGDEVAIADRLKFKKDGAKVKGKGIVAAETGAYTLVLSGREGTTGPYSLSVKGAPVESVKATGSAPPDGVLAFAARAGCSLKITVKRQAGDLTPAAILRGPDGQIVGLPWTASGDKKLLVKGAILAATGDHALTVSADGATAGTYKAKIKLGFPKVTGVFDFTGSSGGGDGGMPTAVVLYPDTVDLADVGDRLPVIVAADFPDGHRRDVTGDARLFSSHPAIISPTSISGEMQAVSAGAAVVRAAYRNVSSPGLVVTSGGVTLSSVAVSPEALAVGAGDGFRLFALAGFSDGSTRDVSDAAAWSTSTSGRVTLETDGAGGALTAGTTTIAARVRETESAGRSLTVTPARPVAITLSPASIALAVSGTRAIVATAHLADGTTRDVTSEATWRSDALVAATVDTSGVITGRAAGTARVRATIEGLTSPPVLARIDGVTVVSLAPTATPVSLAVGASADLGFVATFSDGTTADAAGAVTLAAGNPDVVSVSGSTITALAEGLTTVTASLEGRTALVAVNVTAPEIVEVRVRPRSFGLAVGAQADLSALAVRSDGTVFDVTSVAAWSSSSSALLSSGAGAVRGAAAGLVAVRATANGVTSEPALVRVGGADLVSLTTSLVGSAPDLGESGVVAVSGRDTTSATVVLTDAVALEIDPARLWRSGAGLLGTRSAGATGVVARLGAIAADALEIDVGGASLASLEVAPTSLTVPFGTTGSLFARARATDGSVEDRTAAATWTSTVTSVATVSAGVVTPVSWGTTSVRATDGALTSAGRSVTVTAPPAPTVTFVSPSALEPGDSGRTLTLWGSGFRSDLTIGVSFSGSGVSVRSVSLVSAWSLSLVVDVSSDAPQTTRDATVTLSSPSATLSGTRTGVLSIGSAPVVGSLSPSSSRRGVSGLVVTINGSSFVSGATVAFSGTGVVPGSVTFVSATELRVPVSVSYGAAATARSVTVTNPALAGGKSGTKTDAFQVVPPEPIAVRATPASGLRGATGQVVKIEGANFEAGSSVSFSGSGITVTSTSFVSSVELSVTITISSSATLGERDVTVTLPTSMGSASTVAKRLFTVLSDTPTVTGLSPQAIPAGASSVPVTIRGTSFVDGASLAVSGTGVTVSDAAVVDATTLTAKLTVAGGASTGARSLTVTNPSAAGGKSGVGSDLLTVLSSSSIAVYAVSPARGAGAGGTRVTVTGANFPAGATLTFGSGSARGVVRLDATTILATTPRAASLSKTAATTVDVVVSSGMATGTLTGGYAYLADAEAPKVRSVGPPNRLLDSSTPDVPLSTVRITFHMSEPLDTSTVIRSNFALARKRVSDSSFVTQSGGSIAAGPDGRTVTLTVPASLAETGALFFANVTTSVTDQAGNAFDPAPFSGGVYQTQWRLSSTSDTTAPTISQVSPAGSASGVDGDATVVVTFSEEVDPVTAQAAFSLKQGSTPVAGHLAIDSTSTVLTFTPYGILEAGKTYTVGVSTAVRDRSDNALSSAHSSTFTVASSDGTAPVVDVLTCDDIPADMNGSTTYIDSFGVSRSFRLYLPPDGFVIRIDYSDAGGSGPDLSTLVVKCSRDLGTGSGKIAANTNFASRFTITLSGATFAVPAELAVAAASGVTFSASIKDLAGNQGATKTLVADVTARTTELDPFDARQVWLLRFDHDAYSITASADGFIGSGSAKADTKIKVVSVRGASSPAKADLVEDLEIIGLQSDESGADAKTVTNGSRTGVNAIVLHLLAERIRARLRERYEIDADGSRDGGSVDIEFLLPGERGSLSSPPDPTSWSSTGTFSMFGIGGDFKANAGSSFSPLGRANYDDRNTSQENDVPVGDLSGDVGMFVTHLVRFNVNDTAFRSVVDGFVPLRNTAKTAVGQDDLDAVVLDDSFERASTSNTSAQNARYDAIMDAIEMLAITISSTVAHEIGHSTGLVSDGAPPTGLFGNADTRNTFAGTDTDSHHLDTPGPNLMSSSSSFLESLETGEDAERFSEMVLSWLRRRLLYDETK